MGYHSLKAVLDKAWIFNLNLSGDKCEIRRSELTYVGHRLTDTGLKLDSEKIREVWEMERPEALYLVMFMSSPSEVGSPLHSLEMGTEIVGQFPEAETHDHKLSNATILWSKQTCIAICRCQFQDPWCSSNSVWKTSGIWFLCVDKNPAALFKIEKDTWTIFFMNVRRSMTTSWCRIGTQTFREYCQEKCALSTPTTTKTCPSFSEIRHSSLV